MVQNLKKGDSVFNKNIIKLVWDMILRAKKITLLTHFKPDGDGISACAALEHIFIKLDKEVEAIYPNSPIFDLKRNPKKLLINENQQIPDILIVIDTANYERFYYPKEFFNIPIINIDHHVSNSINGKYNFINPDSSSACEILFGLIEQWDKELIDKYVAECLLFGILYDSQIFHTQSTYPHTLRVCADLIEYGVNLYKLKTELLSNKNPNIIALWGKVLSNIKISDSGKAAWACIMQSDLKKYKIGPSSLIGFNNFLSQISGVDITLLFYQMDKGKTKVSLRSKKTDVNKLADKFGGGGHKNAAGILSDEPIGELVKKITCEL
ncbi:bifunctional oligoribonuclease/PAP phosphatase NrnA [Candidatus Dependentiae bacterium]